MRKTLLPYSTEIEACGAFAAILALAFFFVMAEDSVRYEAPSWIGFLAVLGFAWSILTGVGSIFRNYHGGTYAYCKEDEKPRNLNRFERLLATSLTVIIVTTIVYWMW